MITSLLFSGQSCYLYGLLHIFFLNNIIRNQKNISSVAYHNLFTKSFIDIFSTFSICFPNILYYYR